MILTFQHLRNSKNIGDFSCSPFDYFDWGDATAKDMREASEPYNVSIMGGGKIFGGMAAAAGINLARSPEHIAWGVGTRQSFPISLKYWRARKLCSLVGSRDWGDRRYDFAPCVSCMSPLFDLNLQPEHDVIFYCHGGKTDTQNISIPNNIPRKANNVGSFEDSIRFIASGKTVVSNSYHGVYWSLLLGRKTICIPFSNKFNAYRLPPAYATPKNWLAKLDSGIAQPDMLNLCRSATLDFKAKVDAILAERKAPS
ncbi:hypothetical protein ACEN2J_20360 [Pseudorhodobacter sp. W20_MBD10_FR17]|uniref:hypothetical protein n=1 Tax=Pseudorhodobacter sp. W20_MBD10_FR17 TaxID=3240266 RepID=UPI003F955431